MRRHCLKCAVLCYTLGRWEFERFTRLCMEFKITKDKIVLFLEWNKEKILTLPGFCCPFGLFHRLCGVLRCMSQLSIDGVKAGQSCFERPRPRGRFLAEIRIPCSIFPSNAKDSTFVPFYRRLEKTFLLSAPIRTIFASPLELSTFVRTLWPSFFALVGKIEQGIRISARKRPRGPGLSKQLCPALTPSIESCDIHLKTPQKRWNRPNGQQKPDKVSIVSLFHSKK